MSLIIRQKIFTLTDAYEIKDDAGEPRYSVTTDFLTLGHHIHIFDLKAQREAVRIDERIFAFLGKADIDILGEYILMRREFTFFHQKYTLSNGWSIDGDLWGFEYDIKDQNGETVANVSKQLLAFSDTYRLYTYDPANELRAMAIAITIDMMNCRN